MTVTKKAAATKKAAVPAAKKTAAKDTGAAKGYEGFSADERAAMKDRAKELKAEARPRGGKAKADPEVEVLAKLAEMPEPDRGIGERLHTLVKANAPSLSPKLWYGMPAYARDGKIVCFFQPASKFDSKYPTFGFNDSANIGKGTMWPTHFGITELTAADEAKIVALLKKA